MATINCDMGEAFGLYRMGDDEALMPLISVANVACGFHASDFNHMRATVRLARRHGVGVGAHPSLPDLQGFGRREMKLSREELANCIIYQIGALKGFLEAESMTLNHIKPHGALYGMAARDEAEGLGDAPWPPHYEKQEGEAPRIGNPAARYTASMTRMFFTASSAPVGIGCFLMTAEAKARSW